MPYNFAANSFSHKGTSSEVGRFAFSSPLWGLGATYDVYDALCVRAEALRANIVSKLAISLKRRPVN